MARLGAGEPDFDTPAAIKEAAHSAIDRGFTHFEDWRDKVFEEEAQARHKLDRLIKQEAVWAVEGISARRKRNMGRVRRLQDLREERSSQRARMPAGPPRMQGASESVCTCDRRS